MARLFAFLAIAAAAVAISARPVVIRDLSVTLPIACHFNFTGAANILKADQARAKVLKARSQGPKNLSAASSVSFRPPGSLLPQPNALASAAAVVADTGPRHSVTLYLEP
ncbi:hypothetical protein LXA43DRAFT_1102121 [Ganoderma leucocontextum]|nr:hypothetical protein LXA43DRAFT_1102121 [Ganoderma leucocontextum]